MTQHRKLAVAFRDAGLLKVFQIAIAALQLLQSNAAGADDKLREQVGALLLLVGGDRLKSPVACNKSRHFPGMILHNMGG